ncbi:rRNA N6-adenosine-methyltransferase ZCCHC4-like isoform X3 [Dysidea avara]|uniref:rRNA N6-adenosine-methyltransferase ZCCHC4-like isoform X3 n=1 Tax=Dysidea avara TaxID=196820 RepID=UPI0033191840
MQHCRGVDFVSPSKDAPFCSHGPTLLFERFYKDHPPRKYFACSVYRDRKQCSFFVWADTNITPERKRRWQQLFEDNQPKVSRQEVMDTLETCRNFERDEDRKYCCSCSLLVLPDDLVSHEMHTTVCPVSCQDLRQPSKFLPAITSRKGEAQYFFTDECTKFMLSSLESEGFTTVLCVGTPRFHEAVTCYSTKLKSFLLDIDYRYAQFFTPDQYQQYNLFTAFFYDTVNGLKHLKNFVSTEKYNERIALIIDPPFGGLADMIASGIKQLWEFIGTEITTFLIFPYFLESHVLKSLPNFTMLDYEVTYDNHLYFKKAKHRPSFVRIFTNMSLPGLKLPPSKGYRFCKKCNRYVGKNNFHCEDCNICPSKWLSHLWVYFS